MKKFGFVYGIADPSSMETVYIGETTQPIIKRLFFHCVSAFSSKNEFHRWMMSLFVDGKQPLVYLIETIEMTGNAGVDKRKRWECEQFWVKWHRQIGSKLFNKSFGNRGATKGRKMSSEQKATLSKRRSEYIRGNKKSVEEGLKKAREIRWKERFPLKATDPVEMRRRSDAAKKAWHTRRRNAGIEID